MPKNKPREEKKPIGERISALLARTIRFVTYDIWRITENEVSGLKEIYINIIKTVILAVRGFQSENLQTKASALTYSTLLSIVPLLAVLLGIRASVSKGRYGRRCTIISPGTRWS